MLNDLAPAGIFYLIAAVIVIFAVMTVTLKNIFHCALSLVMALLAIAGIYIYLDAEFLAIIQILIFVGAIMTLIIFAIMLTFKITDKNLRQHNEQRNLSLFISGALAVFLIFVFSFFKSAPSTGALNYPELSDIGKELLTKYALPFEVVSVILLAALIGAVVISSKE